MADVKNDVISIDERDVNSGRILEMTQARTVNSDTLISVPAGYHAEMIIDGERIKTLKSCKEKKLLKLIGSDKEGKSISVLYVNGRSFTPMSWGVGNLAIKYDFLGGESLSVGASGSLLAKLTDAYEFYKSFGKPFGQINIGECTSKIISLFRICASKILVGMFEEARQPIFETDFLVSEMDRRVKLQLCNRPLGEDIPGIELISANVSIIRVNEEDKNAMITRFGTRRKR